MIVQFYEETPVLLTHKNKGRRSSFFLLPTGFVGSWGAGPPSVVGGGGGDEISE